MLTTAACLELGRGGGLDSRDPWQRRHFSDIHPMSSGEVWVADLPWTRIVLYLEFSALVCVGGATILDAYDTDLVW